jgi:hypothetical protein
MKNKTSDEFKVVSVSGNRNLQGENKAKPSLVAMNHVLPAVFVRRYAPSKFPSYFLRVFLIKAI